MRKRSLFLVIALGLWMLPQLVSAQARSQTPLVVVVADTSAIGASVERLNVSRSLVGLVSALDPDQRFAFTTVFEPSEILGPVSPTDPDYNIVMGRIDSRLAGLPSTQTVDLSDALAVVHDFLQAEEATTGSAVYLVTSELRGSATETELVLISPILGRFQKSGWPVNVLVLPNTPPAGLETLEELASVAGGRALSLSVYGGLEALSEQILSSSAKGALNRIVEATLTPDRVLTATVDIAPGTGVTTLIFFKDYPYGSLRLSNPSGLESAAGDRSASYVVETPYVVLWRLVDPAPGRWQVDVRGIQGNISARSHATNKYSLVLDPLSPLPTNEPTLLAAYVQEERQLVVLDGVRMYASVTTADGAAVTYEMMDDGSIGDKTPGDGYFSVTIPPLGNPGNYQIDFDLVWTDPPHRITTRTGFSVQHFPAIQVESVETESLIVEQRTKIADIFINVEGEPYPVTPETLSFGISSGQEGDGKIEFLPRYLPGQDKTWMYDVYFTPSKEGLHRVVFWLRLEYRGKNYVHVSDSLLLSSVPAPQPEIESLAAILEVVQPPPVPTEPRGFPVKSVATISAVLALIALGLLYALMRPGPYGYLYNDRDELVVDFAKLKRHPIARLIFGHRVGEGELDVPGLDGVSFRFAADRVEILTDSSAGSVRVNNQPLIGQATIRHRSWIGAHGKLYSFLISPPEAQMGIGDG